MMKKVKICLLTVLCLLGVYVCMPMTASAGIKTSDFIENVELKGDLRVRYDYQDVEGNDDAYDRLRGRFRMGLTWNNPAEQWKIAAGLATGDDQEAGSTNSTYSKDSEFESQNLWLDYAYAEHRMDNFKLLAGQMKNPYYATMALWDPDVRPTGFSAQAQFDPLFITTGYYQVRYIDRDISRMFATQAGVKIENVLAAVAFYDINRVDEWVDDGDNNLNDDYKYQVADFYVKCDFNLDQIKLSPYGQVFYNFGADGNEGEGVLGGDLDPEDENLGWLVGCKAKINRFSFGLAYGQVAADACPQASKDSDWGSKLGSTDIEGWKTSVGYKLTKHCEFKTTYLYNEPLERDDDETPEDVHRVQVDLKYKF